MRNNYMAEVAKLLGVELGESFKITSGIQDDYHRYYQFTDKKCLKTKKKGRAHGALCQIITGKAGT